jgi:hypothetical protein
MAWNDGIAGVFVRNPNLYFSKRIRFASVFAVIIVFLFAKGMAAELDRDSLEMEVGGLFTVDASNRFKDWENTPARLGVVELSAKVILNPQMEGAITLVSEDDPENIRIDQAVGLWNQGSQQIVFGQQYFNLGLLTTHLISDPSILDLVEFSQAGITGIWHKGYFSVGAGLSSLVTGSDSVSSSDPCVIVNTDVAPGEHLLRIAGLGSKEQLSIGAATNLTFGPFAMDAEIFWRLKDADGMAKGGYYTGFAWSPKEGVEFALRWDGLGDETEFLSRNRFAGGLTLTWLEHIFGSLEIGHDEVDGTLFCCSNGLAE